MKKFNEWLLEKHPEMIDEGILDSLGRNKFIRNSVAGLGLTAGAAGLYGAGQSASSNQSNRVAMQQSEDEFDKFDRENGLDDETINRQLSKLPGTYEAEIRTFDEKGRRLQLTPKEQNRVDSIRKIRSQMRGSQQSGMQRVPDGQRGELSNRPNTVTRKSRSSF